MRTLVIAFAASLLMTPPAIAGIQKDAAVPPKASFAAVGKQAQQPVVESWRYKWHNGHWWYYQTNKQWLFWDGTRWTTYSPMAYQWFTRRRQTVSGFRGPIRRDGPGFSESGEIYQNRD
jgi:hypothetical protein